MNNANVKNTGKYAVAGGNEEIIHLCEQNHSSFKDAYETAIKYHQNEIFKYLYENKIGKLENFEKLGKKCVQNSNFEIFSFLVQQGMKVHEYHDYNLLTIFSDNNTKWCSYLMGEKLDSEFYFTDDVKTSLLKDLKLFDFLLNINMIDLNYIHIENYHFEDVSTSYLGLAIQSENIELMKYLLQKDKINIHLGAMRTLDTTENCDPYVKIKKSLTLAIKTKNLDVVKLLVENDYFKNDNGVAVAKKSRCYKMSYAEYCQKVSADEILDYLNQVEGAKMEIEEEEEEEWNETEEEEWNETEEEEEWNETEEEEECNEIEEEDY